MLFLKLPNGMKDISSWLRLSVFKWRDPWSGVTGILVCAAVLFLSTLIDNCTARMKWRHLLGSAWLVTLVAGFINIVFLMYIR